MFMLDAGWTWMAEDGTGSGTGQEVGVLTLPVASMGADVKGSPGYVFEGKKKAIVAMTEQL